MKDLDNWDLIVDKLQSAVLDIIKHFEFKLSSNISWMGLMLKHKKWFPHLDPVKQYSLKYNDANFIQQWPYV